MMRVSEILNQQPLSRQQDLGTEEHDAERDAVTVATMADAQARGLIVSSPQPPDEQCEFCGRALHHEGFVYSGMVIMWSPCAERCGCEKAAEKWARYDAEQERAKLDKERREQYDIQQAKINKLLGDSGIGKRFQQRVFQTFKTDTPERLRAFKIAKSYADTFPTHAENGTGLYIEGTNGTGKTHLAEAIAMQLMTEKQTPCICKTAGDMLRDIKAAFDKERVTEQAVLKVYKEVALLVVDDLGKEQCTDWSISTLYSIINDRYEKMRPTIITTNYNSNELIKALTPKGYDQYKAVAIVSRLREVSQVLTMAWTDYRTSGK